MRVPTFVVLAVASSGCATTLSTLQTAEVIDVGQVQVTGGAGVYAPLGPVVTLVDQGIQQVKTLDEARRSGQPYTLSEQAQQELLTAAIALAVMPPSPGWEVSIRTGVWPERIDVGLRYSLSALRLDAKYQLLHRGQADQPPGAGRRPFDLAIGFGVSRYIFDNPVLELLDYVQLGEFSRWDLEVPLLASIPAGDVLQLYGGLRYVFSASSLDAKLTGYALQASNASGMDLSLPSTVHTHYAGAAAGVEVGYRWVHAMAELNAGYTVCNPILFGRRRRLGGLTVYPAVGISLKFP
jgi:hypothetical protein